MILHALRWLFPHLKEPALLGTGFDFDLVSNILYFNSKTVLNFILHIHLLEQFRFDKAPYKIDHAFSNSNGSEQMQ